MNFLNYVIFVTLLISNVKSSEFNQRWNDALLSNQADTSSKQFVGMKYNLSPTGVKIKHILYDIQYKIYCIFYMIDLMSLYHFSKQNAHLGDITAEQLIS